MAVGLFIWTTLWWQLRVQLFEYTLSPLLCSVVFGSTLDLWTIELLVSRYWDRAGIIASPHSTIQLSTNCISVTNIFKKDLGLLLRTESRSHLLNRLLSHEGWLYLLKKFLSLFSEYLVSWALVHSTRFSFLL